MRYFYPFLTCLFTLMTYMCFAEGTKELAPNGSVTINGTETTDIAALWIDREEFNSFASYTNPDTNSRLFIHINDPANECVYLGFSPAHPNFGGGLPPTEQFEFRIKDPNGNIVFGPVTVAPADANINSWEEAVNGPNIGGVTNGYDPIMIPAGALSVAGWNQKGDFYIEFETSNAATDGFLIDFWDISVAECTDPMSPNIKTGRLWSYNWSLFAINDFGFPNRPFNGRFFVCAPDASAPDAAYVTEIDFNNSGFMPAAFNVAFNSFGSMNTGDIQADRRSVFSENTTQAEYAIFLNDPVDICETATTGTIEFLGLSRCDAESFNIKYIASKAGLFDILLDFDGGDGMFTDGTADVLLTQEVGPDEAGEVSCVDWDGLDGLGNSVASMAVNVLPVRITLAQGIVHFPIYDAELMEQGFQVTAVRPAADAPLLFYDDSEIPVLSESGEDPVQLNGCNIPCHRWTNYTSNAVIGFGNRCTINSWWFSQRIVQSEMLTIPSFFECEINGPDGICAGSSAVYEASIFAVPASTDMAEIVSVEWGGTVELIDETKAEISAAGTYVVNVRYTQGLGDTCETACEFSVVELPNVTASIDTLLVEGSSININGEEYTEGGTFMQSFVASNGCDSILTINIIELQNLVYYSLDDCRSYPEDSSAMDYSEFEPDFVSNESCVMIVADNLHRLFPEINKHSCTPGVNNSPAICVTSAESCDFGVDNNDLSLAFEISVATGSDTGFVLSNINFYERAPQQFSWIDGATGLNNPPTLYGMRVIRDGQLIFQETDIATSENWTLEEFSFIDNEDFYVSDEATFRVELLGYCLFGNQSDVTAWDIDEIRVNGACTPLDFMGQSLSGLVSRYAGDQLGEVNLELSETPNFAFSQSVTTDDSGLFDFHFLKPNTEYFVRANRDMMPMEGVSTLDLVGIQKHLLGVAPFTENAQYIAADINKSHSVSAMDLLELKKMLLGINTDFNSNTSWRLGPLDNLQSEESFWHFDDAQQVDIADEEAFLDFVGVKVGDVNGSVNRNNRATESSNSLRLERKISYQDQYLKKGEKAMVRFQVSNVFSPLDGLQLFFKVKGAKLNSVAPGSLGLGQGDLSIRDNGKWGNINIIWLPQDGQSILGATFGLELEAKKDGLISEMLFLDERSEKSEVYLHNGKTKAAAKLQRLTKPL